MGEKIALHSAFVRGGFVVVFVVRGGFAVRFWGGFCGALCDFVDGTAKSTRKRKNQHVK